MTDIPDKLYFSIHEASELTGVKPHVLRFWQSEFDELKPKKSKSGRRLYQKKDIETIRRIKSLLYDQKFTIQGARQTLLHQPDSKPDASHESTPLPTLSKIREKLVELKNEIHQDGKNY